MIIGEGKRRLRIFVAILAGVASYLYLMATEEFRYLESEQTFIQFPLISLVCSGLAYFAVLGFYWVVEGFAKKKVATTSNGKNVNLSGIELFEICDKASLELHGVISKIAGPMETKLPHFDNLRVIMSKSWKRPALAYCYGLVSICMLKQNPAFFKSEDHNVFGALVLRRMVELSKEAAQQLSEKCLPDEKLVKIETEDLQKIQIGVKDFANQIMNKQREPLTLLTGYIAETIGLRASDQIQRLNAAAKELLRTIDGLIDR